MRHMFQMFATVLLYDRGSRARVRWRRALVEADQTETQRNRSDIKQRAAPSCTAPGGGGRHLLRGRWCRRMGTRRLKTSERRYTNVHVKGSVLVPSQSSLMILERSL